MKKLYPPLFGLLAIVLSCKELDTKLIASKYQKGVVKIILVDQELEKVKPGSGYLSRGSGFIVTEDGYVFTNRHVVEMCVKGYIDYDYYAADGSKKSSLQPYSEEIISHKDFIKAYTTGYTTPIVQVFNSANENDYTLYHAEVVAMGVGAFDGALLKITGDASGNPLKNKFSTVPIGNADNVQQGEQLCVFGFPQQIRGNVQEMLQDMSTLSLGIMSGLDYVFNKDYGYLKTDAEIHPGNSGGPVFNEQNKAIGIATAIGTETGIGLVGGINGMYYIAALDINVQEKLIEKGLKPPKRAISINSVSGAKQPIKAVSEINKVNTVVQDYKNAKVFFSNISVTDNENMIPGTSKRFTSFTISPQNGGRIWIYADNYPKALNTNTLTVYIDKMDVFGNYTAFKTLTVTVNPALDYTHFYHDFYQDGKYKVLIYSAEQKYIGAAEMELFYSN